MYRFKSAAYYELRGFNKIFLRFTQYVANTIMKFLNQIIFDSRQEKNKWNVACATRQSFKVELFNIILKTYVILTVRRDWERIWLQHVALKRLTGRHAEKK